MNENEQIQQKQKHTVGSIYRLLQEERLELIEGVLCEKRHIARKQLRLASFLYVAVWQFIQNTNETYELLTAPEFICQSREATDCLKPDIYVVGRMMSESVKEKPIWAVDFTDNEQEEPALAKRRLAYERIGIREVWQINTDSQRIFISIAGQKTQTYTFNDEMFHSARPGGDPCIS